MSKTSLTIPASAYLLADHLDAALAAGEDLLATAFEPTSCEALSCGKEIGTARAAQRHTVERIRGLELALISRSIRAREWAQDLARSDDRFKAVAGLFVGGTAPLVDAIAECADATTHDFESGDGILAYLRRHGVVAGDVEVISEAEAIRVNEEFLIARRVPLRALLDLVAAFLDALELHFDLYADDHEVDDAQRPASELPAEDKTSVA